ncbi:MAG TPA: methyl-accepting chemotaxis protein [Steroidobacteraceae bacterium]|nr:methyl-accepting chemotaxis protein [Steroidobacteraceae bacterium]
MSKVSGTKTRSTGSRSSRRRTAASDRLSYADLAGQVAAIRRSQAVIELGMDGTILWANDNYLKVFGYSLEEVRGQHHRIFVPPAARDSAEYRAFWDKLRQGEPQSGRQRRYHKEGRVVWIRASYNAIADRKGKLVKVVALAQDITETIRKSTEYEGELKAVSNAQAVIEFATDGTILTANENFLRAVGYGLEEIRGKHHGVLLDPAQRGSAEFRAFWDKLARGEGAAGQYRRVGKDGREVWLQSTYNPIRDMDDKPFKVVEYSTDITGQVRQSELNAAFKGALDNLSANVMVADTDLNIIYLNDAMRGMMRGAQDDFRRDLPSFEASRLLGASIDSFHRNPAHQRNLLAGLDKAFTSQISIGGRTLRISANPMVDAGGRRLGTVLEWADRTAELGIESDIKALVQSATSGDLSQRMDLRGKSGVFAEIGKGINQLTENMSEVVSIVQAAATEVSRGAVEISQGNADLSQRTEEQAASLEETASSMEQMTSTVKQNADNASQASQLATAARDQADKGGSVVGQAIRAMAEINEASKKIVDIIGVIDEIAFQTNLLALNAAVEAARAGEQGRGFAVVASEVRNLAGRSATAAKEIKALIQDSVRKVGEGSQLVTQSGQTLDHIVTSVKKVSDIVGEIAGASREQSAGIEQVNKAVVQLDEMTQQNAALVEQASAASQSMADQAKSLSHMMERYKVSAQAAAAAAAAAQASARRGTAAKRAAAPAAAPPARGSAPAKAAAKPAVKSAAGGGDDWTEF